MYAGFFGAGDVPAAAAAAAAGTVALPSALAAASWSGERSVDWIIPNSKPYLLCSAGCSQVSDPRPPPSVITLVQAFAARCVRFGRPVLQYLY